MWKITRRDIWSHKFRFLLTVLAVVLGVAFVVGTFVIRDGIGRMPGCPGMPPDVVRALVAYLRETPGHGEEASTKARASSRSSARLRFTGYKKFLDPDGYPVEIRQPAS